MRINFTPLPCVSDEDLRRNAEYSKSLGLPTLGEAMHPDLAVVGGGPSIKGHVEELRSWPGELWAVNGAFQWCRANKINATLFTIDPLPGVADFCELALRAVLSTQCDVTVFNRLRDSYVETIDPDDYPCGPTTASTAAIVALRRGHRRVSFFGCESSFGESTHAYDTGRAHSLLEVVCNGQTFRTSPQMMQQVEYLAAQIRVAPDVLVDRSGGLLSACISDPDIDVIAASRSIYEAVMAAQKAA